MIGDTSHDLLMASNAGVDSRLAVTYGAHPHDHLLEHKPLACLHTVKELDHWLKTTPDLRQRSDLAEAGKGFRFTVMRYGARPAFVNSLSGQGSWISE
jgi:hypothetical protein